jgi:hypothetical protein
MKAKLNIKSENSVEKCKTSKVLLVLVQIRPVQLCQDRAQNVSTVQLNPGRVALNITATTLSLHNRIVPVISFRIIETLIIKIKIMVSLGLSTA